jgi:hypothetical protein
MMYRIRTAITKTIASILVTIAYRFEGFLDHYRGPQYRTLLRDYDNMLRNKIKYTNEKGSYDDARVLLLAYL